VRREPAARGHPVLVDHPQRAEAHPRRVVVMPERERVPAVEPAGAGDASRAAGAFDDHYSILQASSKPSRGERAKMLAGSPLPRLTRKLERIRVPAKNSASTFALSKPDIGPQSRPSARAAISR